MAAGWLTAVEQLIALQYMRCQDVTWHRSVCCSSKAVTACAKQVQWQQASSLLRFCHSATLPCDEFSYNGLMAAMAAIVGQHGAPVDVWRETLMLFAEMMAANLRTDCCSLTTALSALEKISAWERSLDFLAKPRDVSQLSGRTSNFGSNSALSGQSKSSAWHEALDLFARLRSVASFRPDLISLHVMLSAELSSSWKRGLNCMSSFKALAIQPDQTAWQMTAGACKGNWRWPLESLQHLSRASLANLDLALHTACVDSCRHGRQWTSALSLLEELQAARLAMDAACYRAAVGACAACGAHHAALRISLDHATHDMSPIDRSWTLARLQQRDPVEILAALRDTYAMMKGEMEDGENRREGSWASSLTASEVAACWWSLASLGVGSVPKHFGDLLLLLSRRLLPRCQLHELMLISWGAAGIPGLDPTELLWFVQQKAIEVEKDLLSQSGMYDTHFPQEFVERILGIVWSCQQQHALGSNFHSKTHHVLSALGKSLDEASETTATRSASFQIGSKDQNLEAIYPSNSEMSPLVIYESLNKVVLYKPPGYEVHDGCQGAQQLVDFVRQRWGTWGAAFPILKDPRSSHGFLHRLDVPSSGLVLMAKSYEAFYELQLQLAAGRVLRDYVALCHGWLVDRTSIYAPVSWQVSENAEPGELSFCKGVGKYAATGFLVQQLRYSGAQAASVLLIRIQTGRRHQIRSHFAFIGHPLFCDGKYTAGPVFEGDLTSGVERNFLHRHHLAFHDTCAEGDHCQRLRDQSEEWIMEVDGLNSKGDLGRQDLKNLQDVFYPIPKDLQSFLNSIKSIKSIKCRPDATGKTEKRDAD
eukprot:s1279_g20.t1